jgi:Zn-dependent M28 family amino/carboxypeptidase
MNKKVLKLPDLESDGGSTKIPVFILNENTMMEILKQGYYSLSKLQAHIENGEELPKFKFKNALHICLKLNVKNDVSARNVIAKIDGIDPNLKHEYVVLSAHYDHIGVSEAGVYNGADDNGSGTVAVLEVAKALALNRQNKRTIILAFHTGEEKGLLGSKYLTDNIEILEDITACINLDMVGRGVADSIYAIGSDKISTKFHELLEAVNTASTNLHISYKLNSDDEPRRLYYRSDHYSYAKKGIPTVFFFDNDMEDYHKISDDADKINYDKLTQVAELTYRLVLRLANVEGRFEKDELVGH